MPLYTPSGNIVRQVKNAMIIPHIVSAVLEFLKKHGKFNDNKERYHIIFYSKFERPDKALFKDGLKATKNEVNGLRVLFCISLGKRVTRYSTL